MVVMKVAVQVPAMNSLIMQKLMQHNDSGSAVYLFIGRA